MFKKLIPAVALLCIATNIYAADLDRHYIVGQLVPAREVVIRSEVGGIVDAYYKKVSDPVELGEPLLALSIEDNALSVELAKYQLAVSQSELDAQDKQLQRYQSLYKSKGISVSDFDEQHRITQVSRANLNVTQTQFAIAQRTLDKSTPESLFNGVVLKRSIELGQFISVGDALYTIVDMSQVKVRFYLLESDIREVSKGAQVKVEIPSLKQTLFGKVTLVAPAFQVGDPGYTVEVSLDNADGRFKAGMQAHVIFENE